VLRKEAVRQRNQIEHTKTERALLQRIRHPFLVDLKCAAPPPPPPPPPPPLWR
jgi:hypothetical protein